MKCESGTCQYRSVSGLLTSLLRLAKVWHTEQVSRGVLTNEGWEEHYGRYISERLAPYLTSLQGHAVPDPRPNVMRSNVVTIPFATPEERDEEDTSYDPRFTLAAIPSPASVGAEYVGEINSRYHVG